MSRNLTKQIAGAAAMICMALGTTPAEAQWVGTSKTRIYNLAAFYPVPGQIPANEMAEVVKMAQVAFMHSIPVEGHAPEEFILSDTKVWRRVSNDGYIICATGSYIFAPGKNIELAISISTGKFPSETVNFIWDQEAYNLVGCRTPSPTTVSAIAPVTPVAATGSSAPLGNVP
jgi:hypothetical protein